MRTRFSAALQRELREGLREQRYTQVRPPTHDCVTFCVICFLLCHCWLREGLREQALHTGKLPHGSCMPWLAIFRRSVFRRINIVFRLSRDLSG
jgi:hypothetical protein